MRLRLRAERDYGWGSMTGPANASAIDAAVPRAWWERPEIIIALILFSAVPLLYPKIPPLVDLFGHMGRYRVELDVGTSHWLHNFYSFHWAAIGNLGVDVLVLPLGRLIGLEAAVKLIVLTIPPLTVAGFLWVAREVHGRIPPTAYFAVPFALGQPFLFGFVNYALSMALAFLAFALWLRLGRLGRTKLRAWLFVPISVLLFFCHAYGWGVLGLLCFSAEAVRQHDRGAGWVRAGWNAAWHASVLALPIAIMLVWRSEIRSNGILDWFDWHTKYLYLKMGLRDRWEAWDLTGMIIASVVFVTAFVYRQLRFSRNLIFSALVLVAVYALLPRIVFSSAYADMRLVPYMVAVILLAIRVGPAINQRFASILAAAGLVFVVLRISGTTASLAMASVDQQAKLEALQYVPMGSRVVSLVGEPCPTSWPLPRNSHIGAMVVVRRQGFANDQWMQKGQNLLELNYPQAGRFEGDPSERVRPTGCGFWPLRPIEKALADYPRNAFDYLWLVDPPPFDPKLVSGLDLVASGKGWSLFSLKQAGGKPR